ncbi:15210_t:CDS:2 [Funneliformis mosseae]|uniref:15210_t:CDS:1 n=2 Tax=Funneliformis TaxID=1117308 RepID=A0A9N9EX21_FUNMO|nr:15210_t:CDS:2 [Funneliformis mosseae]
MWLAIPTGGALLYNFNKVQQGSINQSDFSLYSNDNIERLRGEWKKQNNGIGLRDVTRSCGGV